MWVYFLSLKNWDLRDKSNHVDEISKRATKAFNDPNSKLFVEGISKIDQLRIGMEIEFIGDQFLKKDYIVAKKIKIVAKSKKIERRFS